MEQKLHADNLWSVPAQIVEELQAQASHLTILRTRGEAISYEQFVSNLFNCGASPADALHHSGTGISSESGEIIDITKGVKYYGKPLNMHHMIEELGDLRFYYQAMLNMLGLTDDQVIAANIQKLSKRYPDGIFTAKHAVERLDKVEEAAQEPRKFLGAPQYTDEVQGCALHLDQLTNECLTMTDFSVAGCGPKELANPYNHETNLDARAAWSLGFITVKRGLSENGYTPKGRAIVAKAPGAFAQGKQAATKFLEAQSTEAAKE